VRPTTVQVNAPVVEHVAPLGAAVTVYPVIAAPPFEAGAVHDTTDDASRADVAVGRDGAPGIVEGTAAAEAADATEVPFAFVAVTVNV